ncbi:hypothetical protein [Streptomyces paromomycinus]|uniref:Recombinase family protein n=1 Tax=Streptomyces paromomycinus TaxID=92743 RepID=A0A401VXK1_STREY|nr:hypothetical protein [Streptomyces paromomycinus]GCD41792.1 hypothetical protein GKJPGBOP_01449 [Streptomyces paromomycinus]
MTSLASTTVPRRPVPAVPRPGDRLQGAHWLRGLRETYFAEVTADLTRPLCVGLYVLVDDGQDPATRLATAHGLAAAQGWAVSFRTFDRTGPTDPATRPQLARACHAVTHGEINGIVIASRTDISPYDDHYEATLRRLRTHGGFLAPALPETAT